MRVLIVFNCCCSFKNILKRIMHRLFGFYLKLYIFISLKNFNDPENALPLGLPRGPSIR